MKTSVLMSSELTPKYIFSNLNKGQHSPDHTILFHSTVSGTVNVSREMRVMNFAPRNSELRSHAWRSSPPRGHFLIRSLLIKTLQGVFKQMNPAVRKAAILPLYNCNVQNIQPHGQSLKKKMSFFKF